MALKALITQDVFDALPDAIKPEYKQANGKYVLDVEATDGFSLENVTGLKSALVKERSRADDVANRLKAFADLDPEKAREAMEKVQEFQKMDPEAKVRELLTVKEKQLNEKFSKELGMKDATLKGLTAQLEDMLITNAATRALVESKGSVHLLLPHVKSRTRLRQTDGGKYVAEVLDESGNARISSKSGSTDPMTVGELIEEMKGSEEFARAFDSSGATGSGATGAQQSAQRVQGRTTPRTISSSDQQALNASLEQIASGEVVVVGE